MELKEEYRQEAGAIADLFVTHRERLCDSAMKILGCRHRAEDVVQDTFLKVTEAASAFTIRQPVAYLHQVVRNLAIDRYRRSALETICFRAEEEGLQVSDLSHTPEAVVAGRQHLSLVCGALGRLPERTRKAFELHRLGGLTQREVARELGVSPTLVNFMIRDALLACRDAMRGYN